MKGIYTVYCKYGQQWEYAWYFYNLTNARRYAAELIAQRGYDDAYVEGPRGGYYRPATLAREDS